MKIPCAMVGILFVIYLSPSSAELSEQIINTCQEVNDEELSGSCTQSCTINGNEAAEFFASCYVPKNLPDDKRGFYFFLFKFRILLTFILMRGAAALCDSIYEEFNEDADLFKCKITCTVIDQSQNVHMLCTS